MTAVYELIVVVVFYMRETLNNIGVWIPNTYCPLGTEAMYPFLVVYFWDFIDLDCERADRKHGWVGG